MNKGVTDRRQFWRFRLSLAFDKLSAMKRQRTPLDTDTLYLGAPDVARIVARKGLPVCIAGVADRIHADFLRWNEFDKSPRVASHSLDGVIELMPVADASWYSFKYVNGHPKNTQRGVSTVMAFGVLADVATGAPRLLAELTLPTAIRTAAMSALAARALARKNSRVMALIGNGAQAEFQAIAFRDLVGIRTLRVYDVDTRATDKLVRNLQGQGLDVIVCASTAEAVRGGDIVTTITADKQRATIITPRDGRARHALQWRRRRLPRQDRVACRRAARCERLRRVRATDAHRGGPAADAGRLRSHRAVARAVGPGRGRTNDAQVTVFDSVGFAIEDYSALHFLHDTARELGIGDVIRLVPQMNDPKDLFGTIPSDNDLQRAPALSSIATISA